MGDQVRTIAQCLGDVATVDLEVLTISSWTLAEAPAIQDEHRAAVG
jgi:hypothetical protein